MNNLNSFNVFRRTTYYLQYHVSRRADPVGRARETKRDGGIERGAKVAGILMAPVCQVWS